MVDAKFFGYAFTIVGFIILIHAAYITLSCFYGYSTGITSPSGIEGVLSGTLQWLMNLVVKLAFLGIYVWIGSILISRGIVAIRQPSITTESKREKKVQKSGDEESQH